MASVGATPPPASAGAACADLCMRWLARGSRFNLAEAAIRVSQSVSVQVGMSGRLCGTHVQRPAIEPVWDSNLKFRIQIAGYVVGYVCGVRRLTCWRIRCFRSLTNPSLSATMSCKPPCPHTAFENTTPGSASPAIGVACGAPKPHSSTERPVTFVLFSFCSGIQSSTVPFGIWALKSKTRWRSLKVSTSSGDT